MIRDRLIRNRSGIYLWMVAAVATVTSVLAKRWAVAHEFSQWGAKQIVLAVWIVAFVTPTVVLVGVSAVLTRRRRARGLCIRCTEPLAVGAARCVRCGKAVADMR